MVCFYTASLLVEVFWLQPLSKPGRGPGSEINTACPRRLAQQLHAALGSVTAAGCQHPRAWMSRGWVSGEQKVRLWCGAGCCWRRGGMRGGGQSIAASAGAASWAAAGALRAGCASALLASGLRWIDTWILGSLS